MALPNGKYKDHLFKPLLVAVYVFLFVAQLNSRYYSIANFFVYESAAHLSSSGDLPAQTGRAHMPSVCKESRPGNSHLSLDKRFYGKSFLYTFYHHYHLRVPCHTLHAPVNGVFAEPLIVRDRKVLLLRGPPCLS